jgi:DNA-binding PadR family transcriptional regulator
MAGLRLVLDGYVNFIEDKSEWKGTKITFEITKKGKKTSSTSPTWA